MKHVFKPLKILVVVSRLPAPVPKRYHNQITLWRRSEIMDVWARRQR